MAITPPYTDATQRGAFAAARRDELRALGIVDGNGAVDARVARWVRLVCHPQRWLELRFVGRSPNVLRGIVARRGDETVVSFRNAQLVTFTAMRIDHPQALVPVLVAGLDGRPPAWCAEFRLPAAAGARADERIRGGADVADVLAFAGVPVSARPLAEAVFAGDRSYVEVVAGARRDGVVATSEVGMSVVDTPHGRLVVSAARAHDGEWISTFAPGTPLAIARAAEALSATLPDGQWFPDTTLTRDFTARRA
ncbi:ESX secretion-associated protein EspG [Mycobacterium sp. MYCO198283]|uniref:ESX secretion-associated protein EspG n=1 Tax=Mycobacterium sp. MYCO198283 TaxID=2883505 RepID=UPI0035AB890F